MHLLEMLRRTKPATAPLASVLTDLNIEPFDTASVEEYKKQKEEQTFTAILPKTDTVGRSHNWVQVSVKATPGSPSIADFVGLASWQEQQIIEAVDRSWHMRFYKDRYGYSIPVAIGLRWRRMSIADAVTTGGVPDYVAHKANQILEKAPEAVLEVDTLESRTHFYDPFLVVTLGKEQYYVEVWGDDDKEFQR